MFVISVLRVKGYDSSGEYLKEIDLPEEDQYYEYFHLDTNFLTIRPDFGRLKHAAHFGSIEAAEAAFNKCKHMIKDIVCAHQYDFSTLAIREIVCEPRKKLTIEE